MPPNPAPNGRPRPSRIDLLNTGTIYLRRRLRASRLWSRALETPALWVTLFLILGTWALMPGAFLFTPRAIPGSIAIRDYVASRDLLVSDEEATRVKQGESREAVLPVYDYDPGAIEDVERRVEQLFVLGRRLLARAEADPSAPQSGAQRIAAELAVGAAGTGTTGDQLRLSPEQAELLVSRKLSPQLAERLVSVATRALRRGVVGSKPLLLENRMRGVTLRDLGGAGGVGGDGSGAERVQLDLFDHLGYPGELRDFVDSEVGDWSGYSSAERRILTDLLVDNLPINLLPNRSETVARQTAASAGAGQVFNQIRKGQVIVRKGDVVDAADARVIAQMRGERQLRLQVPPLAATFFLLALAAAVAWLALSREKVADHGPRRVFGEGLLLLLRRCWSPSSASWSRARSPAPSRPGL